MLKSGNEEIINSIINRFSFLGIIVKLIALGFLFVEENHNIFVSLLFVLMLWYIEGTYLKFERGFRQEIQTPKPKLTTLSAMGSKTLMFYYIGIMLVMIW